MLYLIGGFAVLCGLLLLVRLFVSADPARLARGLKWGGIGVAIVAVLALAVFGRIGILLMPLALLMPVLSRLRSAFGGFSRPSAGRVSIVATKFLRMALDHDAGTMSGTVLAGQFAGRRLAELGPAALFDLLRECRAGDDESARLLEAYLDRINPEWRESPEWRDGPEWREGPGAHARSDAPSGGSSGLSVAEAYAVLGLAPGADAAAIKAAHHRLMQKFHPDHGGSDDLAIRINRARDVLLGRPGASSSGGPSAE